MLIIRRYLALAIWSSTSAAWHCCKVYSFVFALYREEKTEQLIDAKNEIESLDAETQKLKQEVSYQNSLFYYIHTSHGWLKLGNT